MVQCVAINCTNRSGQRVSLFAFPKDDKLRNAWTVKLKRQDFVPTKHSRLCQIHFSPECFSKDPRISESIGYEPKCLRLKTDAVPTIFDFSSTPKTPRPVNTTQVADSPFLWETPNRKRSRSQVIQKRRRLEVLSKITELHQGNETENVENLHMDVCTNLYRSDQCHIETPTDSSTTADKCVGSDEPMNNYSVGCQTSYNVRRRHVGLQVTSNLKPRTTSCAVQATCRMETSSTQCNRYRKKSDESSAKCVDRIDDDDEEDDSILHDPDWVPM
ncbi:THAP domain-containing protein 5-like [Ylistrum balloti]|uniref:THAP domain-containing protein 5-like n=1 Tax=Ylistrum balloti TaxID=509963 RepID=UPI0029058E71|nr:THAP domain-containing protein 5-like [Ylistrum balloti]